jgi:hypothetical protein
MKKFLPILTFAMVANSFASQNAKVIMVKGEVTALKPGDKKAVTVKMGDSYPEDTSILTSEKGVVRLKFSDNSTMNLGPKSKVVVSAMPEKKPNMINLLTGAIKAEVNKKSEKETSNKMIIKTRSAVMGVRGTKFQAGFNPQNGNTSLLTVEGKVAMVKKVDEPVKIVEKVVEQETANGATEKVVEKVAQVQVDPEKELEALDKALETSKEAVEVPAGRYSGVSEAAEAAPTAPTKIAPEQYNAIAKSMGSDKKAEDVYTNKEIEEIAQEAAKVAGDAQKAGGFVDFDSGLYVPPPKDAKKDEKTGVFVAEDIGKVDEKTGEYIPPQGVKLDAKKGFVIDQEQQAKLASNEDKEQLQKTLAKLQSVNEEVKKQVVVNETQGSTPSKKSSFKGNRHSIWAGIRPYSETMNVTNKKSSSEADFYTKQANMTEFNYAYNWSEKWSSEIGLAFTEYKIDDSDVNVRAEEGDDDTVRLGAIYRYSDRTTLNLAFVSQSYYFVYPSSDKSVGVGSKKLDYLNIGAKYFLWDWKMLQVYASGNLMMFGEDEFPSDNSSDGPMKVNSFGMRGDFIGVFRWKDNMGVQASAFLERITHESEDMDWKRFALGTTAQFYWNL